MIIKATNAEYGTGQLIKIDGRDHVIVSVTNEAGVTNLDVRDREEWELSTTAVMWCEAKINNRVIRSEPGDTAADFLAAVRRALLSR